MLNALAKVFRGNGDAGGGIVVAPDFHLGNDLDLSLRSPIAPYVRKLQNMPAPTQRAVLQEVENTAKLKQAEKFTAQILQERQAQLQYLIEMERHWCQNQNNVMDATVQQAEIRKELQRERLKYGFQMGREEAELKGIYAAYKNALGRVG